MHAIMSASWQQHAHPVQDVMTHIEVEVITSGLRGLDQPGADAAIAQAPNLHYVRVHGGSLRAEIARQAHKRTKQSKNKKTSTQTSPKYRSPTFRTYQKILRNKGPTCAI